MQQRAGALIIKNKKLLLVSNDEADFYWSPGGRLEAGETDEQALRRELSEELSFDLVSFELFYKTIHGDAKVDARYYLVEVKGEPKVNNEVSKIHWLAGSEFRDGVLKISPRLTQHIIPDLIKRGLL